VTGIAAEAALTRRGPQTIPQGEKYDQNGETWVTGKKPRNGWARKYPQKKVAKRGELRVREVKMGGGVWHRIQGAGDSPIPYGRPETKDAWANKVGQ